MKSLLSVSPAMHIMLLRRGTRALILPHDQDLIDCPLLVRHWLGTPYTQRATELTMDTPLPGISPPVVLAEILQKGFCALDVYGVVRAFEVPPPADFTEELARDADASATELLRDARTSAGDPHG
jgi:hypothetical protein